MDFVDVGVGVGVGVGCPGSVFRFNDRHSMQRRRFFINPFKISRRNRAGKNIINRDVGRRQPSVSSTFPLACAGVNALSSSFFPRIFLKGEVNQGPRKPLHFHTRFRCRCPDSCSLFSSDAARKPITFSGSSIISLTDYSYFLVCTHP